MRCASFVFVTDASGAVAFIESGRAGMARCTAIGRTRPPAAGLGIAFDERRPGVVVRLRSSTERLISN